MPIDTYKESNSAPKFRAVELKVPSLAKVEDGEIFDDLDDDSDFQVGARVASAEITDMVRKSQIMDLNKSNWLAVQSNQFAKTVNAPIFSLFISS